MDVQNLRLTIRDVATVVGFIGTMLIQFFSLKSDLKDLKNELTNYVGINTLKIQQLEANYNQLRADFERSKYQNLDDNGNNGKNARTGR